VIKMDFNEFIDETMFELSRLKITDNQRNKIKQTITLVINSIKVRVVSKERYYIVLQHHDELKTKYFKLKDEYKKLKYCHKKLGGNIEKSNGFTKLIK
jgi:hypothetical protein